MEKYVVKQQIRGINTKLFANDIVFNGNDKNVLISVISSIIQHYNPDDTLANVPTILDLKNDNITDEIVDKIRLLSTKSVLLQINNSIYADSSKVELIKKLKGYGYKIITIINKEDSIFTLSKILSDYIKLDINNIPDISNTNFLCKKIAYNVNSAEEYQLAESVGMEYYEGEYVSTSENIIITKYKYSNTNFMYLLKLINEKGAEEDIKRAITQDCLLSAQVIRLSNSPYYINENKHVDSIDDAIEKIGIDAIKKWLLLLQFSRSDSTPEEMIQTSYHRAIFCKNLVKEAKTKNISKSEAYLVGLFSTLDVLAGNTMSKELTGLNLGDTIENALIYRDGEGGKLLNFVKSYEEGNNKRIKEYADYFKLKIDEVDRIYIDSIKAVSNLWNSMSQYGGII